jgi:DNA polymerase-3 subunit gamma/tau
MAPPAEAKLIVETPPAKKAPVVQEEAPVYKPTTVPAPAATPKPAGKIGALESIRKQFAPTDCGNVQADKALEQETLEKGWKAFIELLRSEKSSAVQSFDLATLIIKDANSFEATASNNLQQRFLEMERGRACEFLQKELCNKALQFSILLIDAPKDTVVYDAPLSSKEQYLKIVEQYPLVKELRDRLRLELDY